MKVEFDKNGFTAEINEHNYNVNNNGSKKPPQNDFSIISKNLPLLFGILAIITSLAVLPAGILFNAGASIFGEALGQSLNKYVFTACTIITLAVILSDVFSALSIHFYKKSPKAGTDTAALIITIIALIITTISLFSTVAIYMI